MRSLLLATVAVLGLSGFAYAGEGNSEPFPGPDASVSRNVGTPVYAHKDQDPYQFRAAGTPINVGSLKPLASKSQDPYPFRAPDTVIAQHTPVTGPQSGTATASTGQSVPKPMAEHTIVGQGGHS